MQYADRQRSARSLEWRCLWSCMGTMAWCAADFRAIQPRWAQRGQISTLGLPGTPLGGMRCSAIAPKHCSTRIWNVFWRSIRATSGSTEVLRAIFCSQTSVWRAVEFAKAILVLRPPNAWDRSRYKRLCCEQYSLRFGVLPSDRGGGRYPFRFSWQPLPSPAAPCGQFVRDVQAHFGRRVAPREESSVL